MVTGVFLVGVVLWVKPAPEEVEGAWCRELIHARMIHSVAVTAGAICYRDSGGNAQCGTGGGSGGEDPNPDPTTQMMQTTTQKTIQTTTTTPTLTLNSTNTTDRSSYTTVNYGTTPVTIPTYTMVNGNDTTRTTGVGESTSIPTPSRGPSGVGGGGFAGFANSETVNHFSTSLSVLAAGVCLLALH
ncbi:unnamed protein product [Rhizoctonia solani]|uniref:Uncharacterized protein n=1 Tax=Rhizoctonia solani TaxID=456999 RepID=A0A8H3D7E4_9AGAM|nr:unnamed protein product [Rhizoctonia solani]